MPTEISPPSTDGANENITIKKSVRLTQVCIQRNANVVFNSERVEINNATDTDIRVIGPGPTVLRDIASVLTDSVTLGANTVTFANFLTLAGKFKEKWRAEDVAAAQP
jgi:hypothetical protein